ncbi:L,D-transpeptidase [Ancylobacter terrae]|uniref:L,D-transpeptidase n=1 Tax=Ancylobacter sp. sgz301288 TaxID=3342077 RepID=UPI00385DC23E
MRTILICFFAVLMPLSASAQGRPDFAYAAPAANGPGRAVPSNLGGGFIEFLVTGGNQRGAYGTLPRASTQRPWQPTAPNAYPPGLAYGVSRDTAAPRGEPQGGRTRVAARATPEPNPYLERVVVDYPTAEAPGTIVIDTGQRFLYLVQGDGKALRYGVGVGREGFEWSGVEKISRKAEWPDWRPPAEMLARRPDLPRHMPGGPDNPLGARALYLGGTLYRIHGSNEPQTIGMAVSSGCIRMRNDDVIDLYDRVGVGTTVRVL